MGNDHSSGTEETGCDPLKLESCCDQQTFHLAAELGSGAYGMVFHTKDGLEQGYVIKAINRNCKSAKIEFDEQLKIWEAFQSTKHKSKIAISKPMEFCHKRKGKYTVKKGGKQVGKYSCFLIMETLYGVPKEFMDVAAPDYVKLSFVPKFWAALPDMHPVTVHAAFGSGLLGFGKNGGGILKKAKEPGRGFYCSTAAYEKGQPLAKLMRMKTHALDLNLNDAAELVGFAQGFLIRHLNVWPDDVEYGFGYYGPEFGWKINVWDFGMIYPLEKFTYESMIGGAGASRLEEAVRAEPKKWEEIKVAAREFWEANIFEQYAAPLVKGWVQGFDEAMGTSESVTETLVTVPRVSGVSGVSIDMKEDEFLLAPDKKSTPHLLTVEHDVYSKSKPSPTDGAHVGEWNEMQRGGIEGYYGYYPFHDADEVRYGGAAAPGTYGPGFVYYNQAPANDMYSVIVFLLFAVLMGLLCFTWMCGAAVGASVQKIIGVHSGQTARKENYDLEIGGDNF